MCNFNWEEKQPWLFMVRPRIEAMQVRKKLIYFEDYGSCLRVRAGLGVITALRDVWFNGSITVRDEH